MTIRALGYIGVASDRLEDWASWGPGFLGLQLVERAAGHLSFRMDDRRQRIMVMGGTGAPEGSPVLGWEVEDAAALSVLAARLEQAGIVVTRLPASALAQRQAKEAIAFTDPAGTRLEAFHGAAVADAPFVPGRLISGFRTGPLGVGHAVIYVSRIEDVLWFYQDVLGFRLSDFVTRPTRIMFFHVNSRHHSLALIEAPKSGLNHIMMELFSLDDVGQAHDIARLEEGRIGITFGRHANDLMTSFYAHGPSGFMVEYGWGGLTIDPETWTPSELTMGSSLWGHDLTWLPDDALREVRRMRRLSGEAGIRRQVQVTPGNFTVGYGVCPWFEAIRASGSA